MNEICSVYYALQVRMVKGSLKLNSKTHTPETQILSAPWKIVRQMDIKSSRKIQTQKFSWKTSYMNLKSRRHLKNKQIAENFNIRYLFSLPILNGDHKYNLYNCVSLCQKRNIYHFIQPILSSKNTVENFTICFI